MPKRGPGEAGRGQRRPGEVRKGQARRGQGTSSKAHERPEEARRGQEKHRKSQENRERPGEARIRDAPTGIILLKSQRKRVRTSRKANIKDDSSDIHMIAIPRTNNRGEN